MLRRSAVSVSAGLLVVSFVPALAWAQTLPEPAPLRERPATHGPRLPQRTGGMDPSLRAAIEAVRPRIRRIASCGRAAHRRNPQLVVRGPARLVADAHGAVIDVELDETPHDARLRRCIVRAMRGIVMNREAGMVYPFNVDPME